MKHANLSQRAHSLVKSPSPIMIGHMKCAENPYSLGNPTGYLNFGTAENHLIEDFILPKLNVPINHLPEHMHYSSLHGMESLKQAVTHFLEKNLNVTNMNPNNLVMQPGVSALCECLSFSLFDEGDYLIIPTPYYTGFDHDFQKRFKVNFLCADLCKENSFVHTMAPFEKAYEQCGDKNKIKAVLITDPHNPTGEILSKEFKKNIIDFCKNHKLSLICDEIYALSNHNGQNHNSLYQMARESGVDAHLLYGMAKDFGLGGLKVGFYYSENESIVNALKDLSYFHPTSTTTQLVVQNILNDTHFLQAFIPESQRRLQTIPLIMCQQLSQVKFIRPSAGLFMLLDLSNYCKTFDRESEIFSILISKYKINISPGQNLGLKTPGIFRICYAQKKEAVLEFIIRFKEFIKNGFL